MFIYEFERLDWDFQDFTVNEEKLPNESIFKISAKVWACDSGQNLKMTKTS